MPPADLTTLAANYRDKGSTDGLNVRFSFSVFETNKNLFDAEFEFLNDLADLFKLSFLIESSSFLIDLGLLLYYNFLFAD